MARSSWITWGLSISALASLAALGFGGEDQDRERLDHELAAATDASVEPKLELERSQRTGPAADGRGGALAIDRHGLLIVERSAGELIRADGSGARRASLKFNPGLGELALDRRGRAFLADRAGDRIVRLDVDRPDAPRQLASAAVPEPHGLALTPDGATLLITSVRDHALVALDAETLAPRWELELAPEPRAVAVSPDGRHAAVGFLSSSSVALVSLGELGASDVAPRVRWRSLDPRDHVETEREEIDYGCYEGEEVVSRIVEARGRFSVPVETGRRYARNLYALAFVGDANLFAPHQLATPQMQRVVARESADVYGGEAADIRPVVHRVARIAGVGELETRLDALEIPVHQPRTMAYDPGGDRLFVAGYGDDHVVEIRNLTSGPLTSIRLAAVELADYQACGVDGLAFDGSGDAPTLWAHCEFGRSVARLALSEAGEKFSAARWEPGEVLAESARPEQLERGAELFRRSDPRISSGGDLACASCHPEGRSDGLTWRLGKSILQAPVLAGRVGATGPYKWDGQDPTLHASLRHTMERLGGGDLRDDEVDAIVAYLESLPAPRPPSDADPQAIARGRAVFEAASCDACHSGATLSDGAQHELDTTLKQVDTPSLIGLAHSRPYFHDGSAPDLWTLLTDRGTVHDMADTSALTDAQLRDLVAYLESL